MRIIVQGQVREVPEGASIESLLQLLGLHPSVCLVEHNGTVPPRELWPCTQLKDGDRLEIFRVAAGG